MTTKHYIRNMLIVLVVALLAIPFFGQGLKFATGPSDEVIAFHDTTLQAMNGPVFAKVLAESNARTTLFFLYGSWCPHCKRQFGILQSLKEMFNDEQLKIVYVGLDKNAMDLSEFLVEEYAGNPPFTPYHIPADSRDSVNKELAQYDFGYEGNVPYMMIFDADKKPIRDVLGVAPASVLRTMITGLYDALRETPTTTDEK